MYLRIEVKGAEPTEGIRSFIEWRLLHALMDVENLLSVVHVRVTCARVADLGDVRCEISAHRHPARPVVSRASARDVLSAVDAAGAQLVKIMKSHGARTGRKTATQVDAGPRPA